MFDKILVPTDGSDLSTRAAQAAVDFAREKGGKLIGLGVAEAYPYSALAEPAFLPDPDAWARDNEMQARSNVDKIAAAARAADVPCETEVVLGAEPADEIVRVAGEHGCDAIFMGSHGRRGLDRLLLGSVTQKVLLKSKIPVVVLR